MLPSKEDAEKILVESGKLNPGPWVTHCRVAAYCAMKIASHIPEMDCNKAYVLALLHDIGRRFGKRHLGHVYDGYNYMMDLGYDEVAKVCLTHSFDNLNSEGYIGQIDTTED
mgnify:CR=1 FL=1